MYYQWENENLILDCSIQPKSGVDRIVGPEGEYLKIRITAPPTDGKANKHLIRYLAKQFKVKQSAITIRSGHTNRHKRLCIESPVVVPEVLRFNQNLFS
ncbi:MAG: YggU family protein [Pseudohongiella sp.]|nr:YggU family protein [Pseudohongiella sp.]